MKTRWMAVMSLALQLCCWSPAFAQLSGDTQTEIDYLLDFIEISGCEFYRNRSWFDSPHAQEHLRTKFDYLSARNRIKTTEDFIEMAASKSSLSGRPYENRCGDCTTTRTSDWLKAVLARYRVVTARNTQLQ